MAKYIYEHPKWTDFSWQDKAINAVFGEVRLMQTFDRNALVWLAPKTPRKTYYAKQNFGNYTNISP